MKITESNRCVLAEKICRTWIRKRQMKLKAPSVYVVWRKDYGTATSGTCYSKRRKIYLHLGRNSDHRDWIILLAHEFSHYLDDWTNQGKWRRVNKPHGERFQRLLWGTLSRLQWDRASSGHWATGSSAHKPQFKPD